MSLLSPLWNTRIKRFAWGSSVAISYYYLFIAEFETRHVFSPLQDWHDKKICQFIGKEYKPRQYKEKATYRRGSEIIEPKPRNHAEWGERFKQVQRRAVNRKKEDK
mmetsp:Transcript_7973/g.13815  ORF Transcript_7973/g.13815 Transcript_7973/m.13815 type:complete len:106 (+) Transcript_7973:68-385(+)